MDTQDKLLISIVVPVYNEGKNVLRFYEAVKNVFEEQLSSKFAYKIIYVNDGSTDNSWQEICKLHESDAEHVVGILFSRNFGKEIALSAGVECAKDSAAVICIDCDLQHPPALIPVFIQKWQEGYNVVVGLRSKVADYSKIKSLGSKLFYKIMNSFSEIDITPNATDFRLLDKAVVKAFLEFSESSRMFRGLIDWVGFQKAFIPFDAPERVEGQPTYSFKKLVQLAVNSFVSFSWFPLKFLGLFGVFVTFISALLLVFMLVTDISSLVVYTFQGYFFVFNTFLIGIVLCAIGTLALYIEQIHKQSLKRPLFIIEKKLETSK